MTASALALPVFVEVVAVWEWDFLVCNQPRCFSRDTEYYDYGHGEAQETYEAYGMSGSSGIGKRLGILCGQFSGFPVCG